MKNALIVIGILLFFSIAIYYPLFQMTKENNTSQEPQKTNSKFEVIDKYEGCDVIRYDLSGISTYKYFLKCP